MVRVDIHVGLHQQARKTILLRGRPPHCVPCPPGRWWRLIQRDQLAGWKKRKGHKMLASTAERSLVSSASGLSSTIRAQTKELKTMFCNLITRSEEHTSELQSPT